MAHEIAAYSGRPVHVPGTSAGFLLPKRLPWPARDGSSPSLVGAVVLALLITLLPIRRAARYRAADSLRYA